MPIVDCLMQKIRAGPILQFDDTPVKCQGGRGKPNFQARLWAFVNPAVSGVVYRFTPGRDSASLAELLGDPGCSGGPPSHLGRIRNSCGQPRHARDGVRGHRGGRGSRS